MLRVPDASAVWVGDGECRELLKESKRAWIWNEHVKVTGWIRDVRPYIGAADLIVSTSAFESFGYNVAEGTIDGTARGCDQSVRNN